MPRTAGTILGLALLLLWSVSSLAQDLRAPNLFKDLDRSNWAYQAVDSLRSRNIVAGYPETYFRGARTLTRYEFAVAIDRALKLLAGRSDESVRAGLDPEVDGRDIDALRRLTREFHEELASLGREEKSATQILDRLAATPGGQRAIIGGDSSRPMLTGSGTADSLSTPGHRSLGSTSTSILRQFSLNLPTTSSLRPPRLTLGQFAQSGGSTSLGSADRAANLNGLLEIGGESVTGARIDTRVGGLDLRAYYGVLGTVDPAGPAWNGLLLGASGQPQGFSLFGGSPGESGTAASGASHTVGVNLSDHAGRLRLSALTVNNSAQRDGGPEDVTVLGANSDIRLARQLTLSTEWARSIMGTSRFSTLNPSDNDAFNAMLGYSASGLSVSAGYRYVDPLFYTPGYWGRIGNWLNPTNIQGPTFRASYDIFPNLGLSLGGDYFTAARDSSPLGLDANEDIKRALLGVRWGLSRTLNLTADYEGVFWSLNGSRGAGTGMFHPTEHYITLGTGYNLTGNTLLRFNYQMGDLDGHGALNYGSSTRSKYSAFVGEINVKF